MTDIKCKKCDHDIDIENSTDGSKCKNCGYPIENSIDAIIELAKLEDKDLHYARIAAAKKIFKIENATKKKINEKNKAVNRELAKILSDASAQIKAISDSASSETIKEVGEVVADNAAKERDAVCEANLKEVELIIKNYKDEVTAIAESVDLAPPIITFEAKKITSNDLAIMRQASIDKIKNTLNMVLFFLVAPLGMVIIEDYFSIGLTLIISGFLVFPPLSKKIVNSIDWLSAVNLYLIACVVMTACIVRLASIVS